MTPGSTRLGKGMKGPCRDAFMHSLSQRMFEDWPRHGVGCRGIYWQTAPEDTLGFPSFFPGAAAPTHTKSCQIPCWAHSPPHPPLICPLIPQEASLQSPGRALPPRRHRSWEPLLLLTPCPSPHWELFPLWVWKVSPKRLYVALSLVVPKLTCPALESCKE